MPDRSASAIVPTARVPQRERRAAVRPRVVIVGPTPPPYFGVSNATRLILDSPLSDDFELIYLDTSDRRASMNFGRLDLTNIYLALRHVAELSWIMVRRRPDVVYIPISQALAAYFRDALFMGIASLGGARVIAHLRGGYFRTFYDQASAPVRMFLKGSLRFADRVVVLGHSLRHLFEGLVPAGDIRVVHNGVDASRFEHAEHRQHDGPIRISYLGNLIRTKGFFEVVKAAGELSKRHAIECRLAGSWRNEEDRLECMRYIEDNDLQDVIRFVGVVKGEEKLRFLAETDIFVFPTYYTYEGQPWVVLEAMATGLPVITTDHAAIAETIVDGETGLLVRKRDVDDLVEKTERLITDRALRRSMGDKGRERIQQIFSEENFINGLGELFTELHLESK